MKNRRELILEAAQAAADARDAVDADDIAPIDIYRIAAQLGVKVKFLDVSMEGIYKKGPPSMMILSSLRPLPRRAFTCAHELGHHCFGHGSTVDQLQKDDRRESDKPEEVLADAFAGFMLMPTIGLRRAFSARKWKIETAEPIQIATVASEFGVGYATLIAHLTYVLHQVTPEHRSQLLLTTPKKLRQVLLDGEDVSSLTIIDRHSQNSVIDLELGQGLVLPATADFKSERIQLARDFGDFKLFRAASRGMQKIRVGLREMNVRVGPVAYVGKAEFRHLEDPDE